MASFDGYGHGTHVAGMVGGAPAPASYTNRVPGSRHCGGNLSRAAPFVLDSDGRGSVSDVIAALDWILTAASASTGSGRQPVARGWASWASRPRIPWCRRWTRHGTPAWWWWSRRATMAAAGTSISSPGNSRKVITVGSLTDNSNSSGQRRPRLELLVARSDAVRPHPEARPPGARQQDHRAPLGGAASWAELLPSDKVFCGYNTSSCSQHYLEALGQRAWRPAW